MLLEELKSNKGINNLIKCTKGKSIWDFSVYREIICANCNKVYKSNAPNAMYCSPKCSSKKSHKKTKYFCELCKKEFKRRKTKNGYRFCTHSCTSIYRALKAEKNYYFKALLTKKNECNKCKIDDLELLVVHHIDYNHSNNNVENLEILCANCHHKIHFGKGHNRRKLYKFKEYINNKGIDIYDFIK